ncbi:Bud site selection protein 6 [Lecanora helva]
MQAPPNSQRSTRREPSIADSSVPPQPTGSSVQGPQTQQGQRTSSSSSRSSAYRRQNPSQQLSQIEKSVTHLLIATKQLLETLTQWSRHTATEGEVSDVYVRLGYEFNIACRAFNGIGVDTSDLGPVPELLRAILEETLSQEASSASLDRFLPRIRDIIITLLHGLKRKQSKLRARQVKDSPPNGTGLPPSASSTTLNSSFSQMLDGPSRTSNGRRTGSGSSRQIGDMMLGESSKGEGETVPPRYSSFPPTRDNGGGGPGESYNRDYNRESQRQMPGSQSGSSFSSTTSQSTSALGDNEPHSAQQIPFIQHPSSHRDGDPTIQPPPPPPPPPKQQDALAALQRGGDLERRASRRYSAYQISKHLGASPNGVPMLPPTQNTPIPNRGRDVRESMNAVRTRGSGILSRKQSGNRAGTPSPVRQNISANRISEESSLSNDSRHARPRNESTGPEGLVAPEGSPESERPKMTATLGGPVDGLPAYNAVDTPDTDPSKPLQRTVIDQGSIASQPTEGSQTVPQFVPEQSPQPGKELTLFLQYKSKIKKFVLPEGSNDLSVARLQLAFIEKFAWNTHSNGNDLPEIYIQDPISGVRHELEDLRDVKDRSVLVLNIEVLDEVKKHIDEGLGGLRKIVEGVRTAVDSQQTALQQVSDRQQNTTKEMARMSLTPKVASPAQGRSFEKPTLNGILSPTASKKSKSTAGQLAGIQDLRQDLAVVRQTFSSLVSEMNASMSTVQSNASSIKTMAINGIIPDLDASTGRSYVNTGKKTLGEESEKIVNSVDDLQDIVEDLRKDVVLRGVRPLPRQLETVSKSISSATADLKKMQEFLRREKPVWTKIWEKELELVCTDRDLLTMQEELAADLEDDLDKATQTFALVEQATKQQNLQSQGNSTILRSTSKGLAAIAADQEIDPRKAKDGVLGEVRALRPNHETRLEAIERAEKARQRELETRREGEFTKEVATFVEEGRLKKSGGFEETERQRKARDERNMREGFAFQQERAAAKAAKKAEGAERAPSADTAEAVPEQEDHAEIKQGEVSEEIDDTVPEMSNHPKQHVEAGEHNQRL